MMRIINDDNEGNEMRSYHHYLDNANHKKNILKINIEMKHASFTT